MKMPIIYFILYILGLQLVSVTLATENASVLVTHSEESISGSVRTTNTWTKADVSVPSSTAPSFTVSQGITSKDSQDGYNVTTKEQGMPKHGTSNKTGETTINTVTQNSTTGQPNVSAASVPTTLHPTDSSTTTTSITSSSTAATYPPTPAPGVDPIGYIILFILVIAITLLLVVIYFLRKKSKRYSFDLHHKSGEDVSIPLNTVDQEGSFQPTVTNEADKPPSIQGVPEEHITNKDSDSTSKGSTSDIGPATSNGTDKGDRDTEKAPSEGSFGSQVPLSPKDEPGSFILDLKDIDLNCSNQTSVESLVEQQNETNNNNTTGGTPTQESAQAYRNEDLSDICLA
ncbi:hypothetical protein AAFF_G00349470 [Aldrovandia affinis]|uniref:Uncharacterized protein n=1 Tax=Aldrovandia affinis TaxID=143900 RepID=A0AAD7SJ72_9TELE|nr:hypothetical protein AAFF_G00349470 [Aldrovandia affinis]